ncbi:MAG: VOC family protein [Desulfobulbaceae bacterium]|nr:VOC family protein [Desulfobulbaceae bacterium]
MTDRKLRSFKVAQFDQQQIRRYRLGLYVTIGLVLIQFILTGCAVKEEPDRLELTPVTDSPTGIHHPGKFIWNDLLTDDVAVAKKFYGQLFGWTFEQLGGYTVVKNDQQSIAGMVEVKVDAEEPSAARWLSSVSVTDVDKAVFQVIKEGGSVQNGSMDLLNRGKGALVRDSLGAQLLLLNATNGDPEDREPVLGSWLWHELWSNNTELSLAFYQNLFGYDFDGDKNDYLILLKDEKWRAGIRHSADPELEMRWVPAVRVASTEAIAAKAKELGGKVLVTPQVSASGGSVALLADPSAALFIIQRWTPITPEQEK